MAKKSKTSNGKKVWHTEDTTFGANEMVSGLFDREKTKFDDSWDKFFKSHNFHPTVWTQETVIRGENNSLSLYDEVVAALSVPRSGLKVYEKNKRGDFALRQEQRNLVQAEKFTLTDNFVRMAVALSFSYPRYIAQLIPKAIPCFDNLWIEWDELVRFDALQEEFDKLNLRTDNNRTSTASRIGYHIQRDNEGFNYNFFVVRLLIKRVRKLQEKLVQIFLNGYS